MATFLTDLMSSIFVAGPTDSLLLATNASFAALQLILFLLLVATFSYHFAILSVLCGGLWYSINWFVRELKDVQRQEVKNKGVNAEQNGKGFASNHIEPIPEVTDGSHEIQPVEVIGELKRVRGSGTGSGTEHSTEDEWEKVGENEKDV